MNEKAYFLYNNQYPLSTKTEDTRILHWAHYDHVKPWRIDEWKDKIELFLDEPEYRNPDPNIGNIPTLKPNWIPSLPTNPMEGSIIKGKNSRINLNSTKPKKGEKTDGIDEITMLDIYNSSYHLPRMSIHLYEYHFPLL